MSELRHKRSALEHPPWNGHRNMNHWEMGGGAVLLRPVLLANFTRHYHGIIKIKSFNRKDLLQTQDTNNDANNLIPYPEIQKNKILLRADRLESLYKSKIFLKSKRQPPNLKKLLTKAKFSTNQPKTSEVTKCNKPRCGLCKYIKEGSTYNFNCKL